ncbi:MAG: MogA/MoaB family molybdenum cofactor biosynthesis protein [Planctomycetes bacterium]|nr:MogA/MoaB family molybdenum cofactor biosynthesis protein [Planctomycetota bacterium]
MGAKDHSEQAQKDVPPARCAVFTVSDTKTPQTDVSGKLAYEILVKFGHSVVDHRVIRNDRKALAEVLQEAQKAGVDLTLAIGGTGISKKDVSVEAVRSLIDKELPGFGEMFRSLSAKEIGVSAILSRSVLGTTEEGHLIAALPGSPDAVRLALEEILMNELKHLLWELRKHA